jgi:hypothetical protein
METIGIRTSNEYHADSDEQNFVLQYNTHSFADLYDASA